MQKEAEKKENEDAREKKTANEEQSKGKGQKGKGEKGKPSFFPHDRGVGTEQLNKLMKMVGATMPKKAFLWKVIYPDV